MLVDKGRAVRVGGRGAGLRGRSNGCERRPSSFDLAACADAPQKGGPNDPPVRTPAHSNNVPDCMPNLSEHGSVSNPFAVEFGKLGRDCKVQSVGVLSSEAARETDDNGISGNNPCGVCRGVRGARGSGHPSRHLRKYIERAVEQRQRGSSGPIIRR
ncbi:unnamed protein product [Plutella xylostella]|uniref:(diamondback moth) hypothetical protein n=1 Tax=Plutella xylostella TaxID=51655 RepID=A0A8S4EPD6_PLUXY|nr:unnamed protein product [Plutella xylostella]